MKATVKYVKFKDNAVSIKFVQKGQTIESGVFDTYEEDKTIGFVFLDWTKGTPEQQAKFNEKMVADSEWEVEEVGTVTVGERVVKRLKVLNFA